MSFQILYYCCLVSINNNIITTFNLQHCCTTCEKALKWGIGAKRVQCPSQCPGHSYHEALDIMSFKELATHHDEICETLFDTIVNDDNHRL